MFHIHQIVVWWFSFWCSLPLLDLPVCVKWKNDSCFIMITQLYHDIVMKLLNIKLLSAWPISLTCFQFLRMPGLGVRDGWEESHSLSWLSWSASVCPGGWEVGRGGSSSDNSEISGSLSPSPSIPRSARKARVKKNQNQLHLQERHRIKAQTYILKSRALLFFREFNLT